MLRTLSLFGQCTIFCYAGIQSALSEGGSTKTALQQFAPGSGAIALAAPSALVGCCMGPDFKQPDRPAWHRTSSLVVMVAALIYCRLRRVRCATTVTWQRIVDRR